ncbi:MAG: DUF4382 domain-containing protein [Bacteroidales bacterium]|nr:DUF4382 domain-containing protein [Bacteroidales bacterium]HOY37997.1 DUF4382 domain-containing protein [Bacteroidales bacterium]
MKNSFRILLVVLTTALAFTIGCKDPEEETEATFNLKITDARVPQAATKDGDAPVLISDQLTKCEVTYADIELKKDDGEYISLMTSPTTVDLRDFQGTLHSLLSISIPVGSYTHLKVTVSGVSTTYQNNNYTASVDGGATVTLNNIPGTFTEAQGVPDVFSAGAISYEVPLAFTLINSEDVESVQLQFDVDGSVYIVPFTYQSFTWNFAALHTYFSLGYVFEQGIQQIRHSPPLGITIVSANDVDYYGIHTFVDFDAHGGTINSHTSQHVFRGSDGSLLVDAEAMTINNNVLSPNTVNATGESDIRADETFHYTAILNNLAGQGYTLLSGHTYYFSLRKTWNITTNGTTYDLTRICEPIPVTIP